MWCKNVPNKIYLFILFWWCTSLSCMEHHFISLMEVKIITHKNTLLFGIISHHIVQDKFSPGIALKRIKVLEFYFLITQFIFEQDVYYLLPGIFDIFQSGLINIFVKVKNRDRLCKTSRRCTNLLVTHKNCIYRSPEILSKEWKTLLFWRYSKDFCSDFPRIFICKQSNARDHINVPKNLNYSIFSSPISLVYLDFDICLI